MKFTYTGIHLKFFDTSFWNAKRHFYSKAGRTLDILVLLAKELLYSPEKKFSLKYNFTWLVGQG